ncbi:MAG: pyridoxamine 5'-phosphate oxidase family protein [Chitinophagaceae bacterium]
MFGTLTSDEITHLLSTQLIGRIGCHYEGITYVVPISFVYSDDCIYGHTGEGMKLNFMRNSPSVCFQVDDTRNLDNWKSAICWGNFEEITEPSERGEAIEKLLGRVLPVISSETMHISPQWPFPPQSNEHIGGIVFRIRLTRKSGRYERSSGNAYFAT